MEICINYGGMRHCFLVPIVELPVSWGRPGPGPINYPAFMQDVIILASVSNTAKHIGDENVRNLVHEGVSAALRAVQEHAGADVTIRAKAEHR
ncbi:hypothetical protein SAMN05444159_2525 [Bradyrhizobium lablabi]|jgi:hypothetical protein|uniref:Uncharacterized protein n=1 Tax=Bradyrhizobium lablabi TaxID=722472 RepID=A0A1M6Q1D9_9BRAD|nr:hypothetical protein [Bradyrhizobium lablabi]SHK13973.1 hypothetical protein SAMN05444159_2525 [Bradyrhizobium lablabi]